MQAALVVVGAALGAAVAMAAACVPGLHVYSLLGALVLAVTSWPLAGLPPELLVSVAAGMIVAFSLGNSIPAVFLSAPDESAVFAVAPAQRYLLLGRGYEACSLMMAGGLGALVVVVCVFAPLAPVVLPFVWGVLRPHVYWILWAIIAFMLLSEWPKGGTRGQGGWRKVATAWSSLGAGLLTFLFSGILGFVLMYRTPVSVTMSYQNIMPAFVGLFALPSLILNLLSHARIPVRQMGMEGPVPLGTVVRGVGVGVLGGGLAAVLPVVTGGVGGLLAGQAAGQRDRRVFLISQGASKSMYYVGAFLLLFVPGLHMRRGGAAWMLQLVHVPRSHGEYFMALAAVCVAAVVCALLFRPCVRGVIALQNRYGFRRCSLAALGLMPLVVFATTGLAGLGVMLVGTAIGLLPLLYHSRRMNCLGVLLLPMACRMSGCGAQVAGWLGLI